MSGEIMRAVLTENCKSRRFKAYTAEFAFPGNTPVTTVLSSQIQFTQNTLFLWTNFAVFQIGGSTQPVQRLFTVAVRRVSDGRLLQNVPTLARAAFGSTLSVPCELPMMEYMLFDGDDMAVIDAKINYVDAAASGLYAIFGGIEYIP